MIILISGASHVGKTLLAQKLLEIHHIPYLSIDHLKMGLIRSGYTDLTPCSDDRLLTGFLWPIVCEMIKTAIENKQHLIIEGCYIPFTWDQDFTSEYSQHIHFICLAMSEQYIHNHFDDILSHASDIESRMYDDCQLEDVLTDNRHIIHCAEAHQKPYYLIENDYESTIQNIIRSLPIP